MQQAAERSSRITVRFSDGVDDSVQQGPSGELAKSRHSAGTVRTPAKPPQRNATFTTPTPLEAILLSGLRLLLPAIQRADQHSE
jgi:hypothetical protein